MFRMLEIKKKKRKERILLHEIDKIIAYCSMLFLSHIHREIYYPVCRFFLLSSLNNMKRNSNSDNEGIVVNRPQVGRTQYELNILFLRDNIHFGINQSLKNSKIVSNSCRMFSKHPV